MLMVEGKNSAGRDINSNFRRNLFSCVARDMVIFRGNYFLTGRMERSSARQSSGHQSFQLLVSYSYLSGLGTGGTQVISAPKYPCLGTSGTQSFQTPDSLGTKYVGVDGTLAP